MAYSAPLYMEVRWRLHGSDEAWSEPRRVNPVREVVVEELDRTKQYDFEARNVSACGAKSDWVPSTHTVPDVPAGNLTLADIKTEADNAAADALAANAELANIASDNVLSQGEKPVVIRDTNVITTEQAGIDAQATAFGVTTEKTAYDSAVTALTTYLATLTTPVLWSDLSGDTTIVGTTFRSKFADVYTTRQALLNAIYAAAKMKADAAQGSADTANSVASQQPIVNPNFDATPAGYGWVADAGSGWFTDAAATIPGGAAGCAKHVGSGSTPSGSYRNVSHLPCQPGQVVKYQALIQAIGANGYCTPTVSFESSPGVEITSAHGALVTGTTVTPTAFTAVAPAGTTRCVFQLTVNGHTSGTYLCDNLATNLQPSSLDEVPDGPLYARVLGSQLASGTIPPPDTGDNLCPNSSFELNSIGAPMVSYRASGDLCDGWYIGQSSHSAYALATVRNDYNAARVNSGNNRLSFFVNSGLVLANGTTAFVNAFTKKRLDVKNGEVYYVYGYIFSDSGATPPAGVACTVSIYLRYYDVNDAYINQTGINYTAAGGSMTVPLSGISTVPSNASYARVCVQYIVANNSGASVTTDINWRIPSVDSITINKQHALENAGSGRRLGDLRNQVMVGVGNYASGWSGGSISYSASTTSATLSVSSATMQIGGSSLAYNAASTTVSGSAGSTVKYYLYYDDPGFAGGSKTLNATTSQITALANDGRVLVGSVTVTYPTSGTGSGGGGTGCPDENAWVLRADPDGLRTDWCVRAKEIEVGHHLRLTDGRAGLVTYSERKSSRCVRVVAEGGKSLTCSDSAPLELAHWQEGCAEGACVPSPMAAGRVLRIYCDRPVFAARIDRVDDAGSGFVQHITCENACFWTGDDPDYLFGHHNLKPIP